MVLPAGLISKGYYSWFWSYFNFFTESMCPFNSAHIIQIHAGKFLIIFREKLVPDKTVIEVWIQTLNHETDTVNHFNLAATKFSVLKVYRYCVDTDTAYIVNSSFY